MELPRLIEGVEPTGGGEQRNMSFSDLPLETRKSLFDGLRRLYDELEERTRGLPEPRGSCAGCGRCCTGPPLYMTCSDLELAYAQSTPLEGRVGVRARFVEAAPDRRHAYASFPCPFYSQASGCTVYERRPFACRIWGRYARAPIEWDFCVYQESTRLYASADELPMYAEYLALLSSYPAHRGYPVPDALPYTRPAVELLLGELLPWSSVLRARITL